MPKTSGLTQKMKNFCHKYLECGNGTEAYLAAYDTDNEKTAAQEASRLLRRDDVTEYIKELTKPTVNRITNERERKRNIIWDRIELCIEKGDEAAIARYMDILNKMDSEYVNINRNIDEPGALSKLSNEQLNTILDEVVDDSTN